MQFEGLELKAGFEALMQRSEDQKGNFELHSVSYYPSSSSEIWQSPTFWFLVDEFGINVMGERPLRGGPAIGSVEIGQTRINQYKANLRLLSMSQNLPNLSFRFRTLDLTEIPIPRRALAPNTQRIERIANIDDEPRGIIYSIYTRDFEGSEWSLHVKRPTFNDPVSKDIHREDTVTLERPWFVDILNRLSSRK
jgi:hypothetical protein